MKYGLVFEGMDARPLAELAHEAEESGWDGVFVWDGECGIDVWIALAAVALRTERMRFGTMVTPPSRRRPWKLASETATLDRLSTGRVILPVGLGAYGDHFGEETNRKVRAKRLDESLEIITGLWSGQRFSYSGEYYRIRKVTGPTPVQFPRIPIWVVGAWPRMKSMRRVLHWDGLLPAKMNPDGSFADVMPADIQAMKAFIAEHRSETTSFDIVMEGTTPGDDREQALSIVRPYADAGATWWLESAWLAPRSRKRGRRDKVEDMRTRIRQGPPRLE